jgi:hypothetical protein
MASYHLTLPPADLLHGVPREDIASMIFAIRETAELGVGGLCRHPIIKRNKHSSPGDKSLVAERPDLLRPEL